MIGIPSDRNKCVNDRMNILPYIDIISRFQTSLLALPFLLFMFLISRSMLCKHLYATFFWTSPPLSNLTLEMHGIVVWPKQATSLDMVSVRLYFVMWVDEVF